MEIFRFYLFLRLLSVLFYLPPISSVISVIYSWAKIELEDKAC